MRRLAILGSTGSIGNNALRVISEFPGQFKVAALSANTNIELLRRQIKRFHPSVVAVGDEAKARILKKSLSGNVRLLSGKDSSSRLLGDKSIDLVLIAISGAAALNPIIKAIELKKTIALANKEALVMAGSLIMEKAKANGVAVIPIDSEQSAIWQCLEGRGKDTLRKIYLTASGGPLKDSSSSYLKNVSARQVLRHPRWQMGRKITVDSATLMNKGLELIEAMRLFDVPASKIEILIHPQAVIHSMVEFIDGVIMAQLSITDMRIPIQYALSYPDRLKNCLPQVDFCKLKALTFAKPDIKKFPCLALAYRAAKSLGTMPCVLNAADEIAVEAFLSDKLRFISIPKVIERVMDKHKNNLRPALEDILRSDRWARKEALKIING